MWKTNKLCQNTIRQTENVLYLNNFMKNNELALEIK